MDEEPRGSVEMLEQLAHSVISSVNQEILTKAFYKVENSPKDLIQLRADDPRYLLALGALETLGYIEAPAGTYYLPSTLTEKGSRVYQALKSDGAFTALEEAARTKQEQKTQPSVQQSQSLFPTQQDTPPPADSEIPF